MSLGFGIGVWNILTSKVVRAFIVTLHNKNRYVVYCEYHSLSIKYRLVVCCLEVTISLI